MIKTLKNLLKQDKERYTVPRKVQDVIPVRRIWKDGIFMTGGKFAKKMCIRDSAEGTSNPPKKSVREELREIQAARKQEAELPHEEKTAPAKKAAQKTTTHKQPPKKRKSKSKER